MRKYIALPVVAVAVLLLAVNVQCQSASFEQGRWQFLVLERPVPASKEKKVVKTDFVMYNVPFRDALDYLFAVADEKYVLEKGVSTDYYPVTMVCSDRAYICGLIKTTLTFRDLTYSIDKGGLFHVIKGNTKNIDPRAFSVPKPRIEFDKSGNLLVSPPFTLNADNLERALEELFRRNGDIPWMGYRSQLGNSEKTAVKIEVTEKKKLDDVLAEILKPAGFEFEKNKNGIYFVGRNESKKQPELGNPDPAAENEKTGK